MKQMLKKITASLVCAALLVPSCLIPLPVQAASVLGDDAYSTLAKVGEANSCNSTQGLAVNDNYVYSVQIKSSDESRAVVYRVDRKTGESVLMTDGSTELTYFTNLGHGNAMDMTVVDGVEYLCILTNSKISLFAVNGTTLTLHGEYYITHNGNVIAPSAISVYKTSGTTITFLTKGGSTISKGSVDVSKKSGTIPVTVQCELDVSQIPIDGTNRDFTSFVNQGMGCVGDYIFVPITGNHVVETLAHSLILGFDISKATGSNTLRPDADKIFYIVSEDYPALFEIEDVDIASDGKLYFNTNGRLTTSNTKHDGVFMLKNFTFSTTPDNPNVPDNPDNPGTPSNPDNPDIDSQIYLYLAMLYSREYDITATAGVGGSISDAGVTKVKYSRSHTYTITPEAGYEIESVLVNGKDVGPVSSYTFDRVNKKQTISVTFKKLPWVNPFTDVSKADWFYSDVKYVAEKGIMNGVENGRFDPAAEADRAMLVTTLWRMESSPVVNYLMQFEDVPGEQWYTEAVRWSAAMQIVEGYDGHFCPEDSITREEIVTILCRFAQHNGVHKAPTAAEITHDCSDWAQEYILWAQANGILDGIGTDISDMTATASRAEIAAFLSRFMKNVMSK